MSKRDEAKRLFLHYMQFALGDRYSKADRLLRQDYEVEIQDFVDLVIDAAKEELRSEGMRGRP